MNMVNQFSRFELLIGQEKLAKLSEKTIAIFGLGGVGGHACDALARSGIVNFVLIDNDVVSVSNINRQIIADLDTLGKNKVDVMKERILKINKNANVKIVPEFFLPNNNNIDFSSFDYVIDAIDTITSKIEIARICNEMNIPLISSMGTGNKLDPTKLEISDIFKTSYCPLAKVMRHELKKRGINRLKVVYSKEKPIKINQSDIKEEQNNRKSIPGSSAFVPSVAGIIIASEVVKDIINE